MSLYTVTLQYFLVNNDSDNVLLILTFGANDGEGFNFSPKVKIVPLLACKNEGKPAEMCTENDFTFTLQVKVTIYIFQLFEFDKSNTLLFEVLTCKNEGEVVSCGDRDLYTKRLYLHF